MVLSDVRQSIKINWKHVRYLIVLLQISKLNILLEKNLKCISRVASPKILILGVPAVVQWVKNPIAAAWATAEVWVWSPAWCNGLKDPVLLQLWLGGIQSLAQGVWPLRGKKKKKNLTLKYPKSWSGYGGYRGVHTCKKFIKYYIYDYCICVCA